MSRRSACHVQSPHGTRRGANCCSSAPVERDGSKFGALLARQSHAEPGTAARAGERVVVYCTGLGTVTPAVESGAAAPGDQPARVVASVELTIGNKRADVISANLTPGGVGVYEVTAVVPDGVTGDAVVVTVGAAGQVSPAVTMAIE